MGRTRLAIIVTVGLAAAACGSGPRTGSGPAADGTQQAPTPSTAADGGTQRAPTTSAAAEGGLKLRFGKLTARTVDPGADGRNATAAVAGVNAFAVDLYRALATGRADNVVVGPYSVATALGMIYAGARGVTADEMGKVLHNTLPGMAWHDGLNAYDLTLDARTTGSPTEWAHANKVWMQRGLAVRDDYLDVLAGQYGSALAEADFASDADRQRKIINTWVAARTKKRIAELFPSDAITPETVIALVDAVALDAPWEFPFDPKATQDETFTRLDGGSVTVPMMHYNEYLPSITTDQFQAVELPYGGGALSMVVIVPRDLVAFESMMTAESLSAVFGTIKDGGIHLSLPKWTARTHQRLNDTLAALGMPSAFGAGADFTGVVEGGGLHLAVVEHEAFVEVSEKGTRAAAATGGAMASSHGPTVTVNRPFLYVIRDRGAGTMSFVGRVTDPSTKA